MRFYRVWRVVIGRPGQKGLEFSDPLRVIFEISRDTGEDPNETKLQLYNLSAETRRVLETPDTYVALYGGYLLEHGPLLLAAGNVTEAITTFQRPDVVTEVILTDGYVALRDSASSLGYGPGVTSGQVMADLSRQMGLKLDIPADVAARTWQHGFSFYGASHRAMHKITQGTGLEWSIQNGVMQVVDRRGVSARRAVVLSADSGLLGVPERTRSGAKEKAVVKDQTDGKNKNIASSEQQRTGWKVKSLLLPGINPGDTIKLESRTVTDFFRVEKMKSNGDSDGSGPWETELELVDLDAPTKQKKAGKK